MRQLCQVCDENALDTEPGKKGYWVQSHPVLRPKALAPHAVTHAASAPLQRPQLHEQATCRDRCRGLQLYEGCYQQRPRSEGCWQVPCEKVTWSAYPEGTQSPQTWTENAKKLAHLCVHARPGESQLAIDMTSSCYWLGTVVDCWAGVGSMRIPPQELGTGMSLPIPWMTLQMRETVSHMASAGLNVSANLAWQSGACQAAVSQAG